MKHEKAPTAPPPDSKGYWFVYAHVMENQRFLAFLANFRWPKLSKDTSTRRDLSYEHICRSLRPSVTKNQPGISHVLKNRCFWTIWPNSAISGGQIWPKRSKGTSTRHYLSYEPIPRSLRPSVTNIQPGKEIDDRQTDRRTDRPPTFGVGAWKCTLSEFEFPFDFGNNKNPIRIVHLESEKIFWQKISIICSSSNIINKINDDCPHNVLHLCHICVSYTVITGV